MSRRQTNRSGSLIHLDTLALLGLEAGPLTVTELLDKIGDASRVALWQALGRLRMAGLAASVVVKADGRMGRLPAMHRLNAAGKKEAAARREVLRELAGGGR